MFAELMSGSLVRCQMSRRDSRQTASDGGKLNAKERHQKDIPAQRTNELMK